MASALLGIGGGLVKVPVMHVVMGVPLRVATATSNLMMGITASAGAIIYLSAADRPYVAAPTALGVFVGASVGSRVATGSTSGSCRGLFVAILLLHCLPDAAAGPLLRPTRGGPRGLTTSRADDRSGSSHRAPSRRSSLVAVGVVLMFS